MTNQEKIKNILIEELSKCNNFNYKLNIGDLHLKVNTKKIFQCLVEYSYYFEGGVGNEWRFEHYKNSYFWLSNQYIWSKFEKETELNYADIQQLVKSVLEEGFKLWEITIREGVYPLGCMLEEGFNLKGITLIDSWVLWRN